MNFRENFGKICRFCLSSQLNDTKMICLDDNLLELFQEFTQYKVDQGDSKNLSIKLLISFILVFTVNC